MTEWNDEYIESETKKVMGYSRFGRSDVPYLRALEEITRLRSELDKRKWIPVSEAFPESGKPVLAICKLENGKSTTTRAIHISPKTMLSEDFFSDEYDCSDIQEYDEEKDCYWVSEGWFEYSLESEVDWKLSCEVTHWQPIPEVL